MSIISHIYEFTLSIPTIHGEHNTNDLSCLGSLYLSVLLYYAWFAHFKAYWKCVNRLGMVAYATTQALVKLR